MVARIHLIEFQSKHSVIITTAALIETMIIRAGDIIAPDNSNKAQNQKRTEDN